MVSWLASAETKAGAKVRDLLTRMKNASRLNLMNPID